MIRVDSIVRSVPVGWVERSETQQVTKLGFLRQPSLRMFLPFAQMGQAQAAMNNVAIVVRLPVPSCAVAAAPTSAFAPAPALCVRGQARVACRSL